MTSCLSFCTPGLAFQLLRSLHFFILHRWSFRYEGILTCSGLLHPKCQSAKGSTFKGKNLLLSLKSRTFQRGYINNFDRIVSLKV